MEAPECRVRSPRHAVLCGIGFRVRVPPAPRQGVYHNRLYARVLVSVSFFFNLKFCEEINSRKGPEERHRKLAIRTSWSLDRRKSLFLGSLGSITPSIISGALSLFLLSVRSTEAMEQTKEARDEILPVRRSPSTEIAEQATMEKTARSEVRENDASSGSTSSVNTTGPPEFDTKATRRLLRKMDRNILPIMCIICLSVAY